jgi:DNA/RNA-binding domain of Phe-tRNA-synthetase-like protein
MQYLRVSEEIFRSFPDAVLGVIVFQGIDNKGENPEILSLLRQEEAQTVQRFASTSINEHPHIAPWREAYRKFGAKPKDYPSSIENLVRRVSKGHQLRHINLLVDIYNTISLRHLVPVGGEDIDKMKGDIRLTFAGESEPPVTLLGEPEARSPKPGEVIYKDDIGAICRRWNWKEADRTKFTEDTVHGFLVIEGLPPVGESLVEKAIDELFEMVKSFCGGELRKGIVSSANFEMEL